MTQLSELEHGVLVRCALIVLVAIGCDDPSARGGAGTSATPSTSASLALGSQAPPARPPSKVGAALSKWSFDDGPDALPAGWTVAAGRWQVTADGSLRQLAQNRTSVFNLLLTDARAKDFALRVRMRAINGKIDQGGGLVWRALGAEDYYVARYNPLEKNFRFYSVKGGKRTELGSADVDLPGGTWHTLELRMQGDHFEGRIDGRSYLDVRDATFADAGAVGLWTKADAVTEFDDLELEPTETVLDAKAIGAAVGSTATTTEDGVVRVTWPRTDVKVTIDQMAFEPAAGLGSWAALSRHGAGVMLMGDTVVFEDEVTPAMDAAFAAGLEVTAIHNHFLFDRPKVYFMHIGGHGDAIQIARGVRRVWDAVRAVRKQRPEPAESFGGESPRPGPLDAATIARIVGHSAETKNGVVKITVGRQGTMHGTRVGSSMGLTTWASFSGSDALAAVAGDFIMTAEEVQPVLRALRKAKLHVVALHNHMVGGEPFFYFTHFWGKGPAAELARGIRDVLDVQARVSSGEH